MWPWLLAGVAGYFGVREWSFFKSAKTLGTVGGSAGIPATTMLLAKSGTLGTVKLAVGDAVAVQPLPNVPSFNAQIGLNTGGATGPALAKAPFDPAQALGVPVGTVAFIASAPGDGIVNYYFTDPTGKTTTGSVHVSVR